MVGATNHRVLGKVLQACWTKYFEPAFATVGTTNDEVVDCLATLVTQRTVVVVL